MAKILIVDDEEELRRGLRLNLANEGYEVLESARGDTAISLAMRENPDLIVLDIMLPGKTGLDVCRELREMGMAVPIIMLTAKGEEIDRVVGLELGADDYVTKPFSLRELLARVRANLRRQSRRQESPPRYQFDGVEVDFLGMRATRSGESIVLTSLEFDLLRFLIQHRGEVVTRELLLSRVWGYQEQTLTRTVDTHILKLRQKLEQESGNPRHIITVYGEGYKFVD